MLNEKILSVFDAVMEYLSGDEYVVIDRSELINKLPAGVSANDIAPSLVALQTNELIKLRYQDSAVVCVASMPKGALFYEKRKEEKRRAEELAAKIAADNLEDESEETDARKPGEPVAKVEEDVKEERKPLSPPTVKVSPKLSFSWKTMLIAGLTSFFGAFLGGALIMIIYVFGVK